MSDDDIEIRQARPDEIAEVARLRWQWVLEVDGAAIDWAADGDGEYVRYFVDWAASHPDHRCTIVVRRDAIIGMAWLAIGTRVPTPRAFERLSGDIQSVYMTPSERNRGLGHRLLADVVRQADELGLQHVTVHASPRSITAYERVGFTTGPRFMHRVRGGGPDVDR
jgi:GNAT superfamily N-acetyltransferase